MWIQACLNGSRSRAEHSAVPQTPAELAEAARGAQAAGAVSLHLHPRDATGRESLHPEVIAAAVSAVRAACPLPLGLSTAAYMEPDAARRLALIEAWTVLPDFVSVNLDEEGIADVIRSLGGRDVELEAGISERQDVETLLALGPQPWARLLIEPWDEQPQDAQAAVDALLQALDGQLPAVPRLIHSQNGAAWAVLERAVRSGHPSRIGLEDVLTLPDGTPAPDNAALVRAALALG